MAVIPRRAERRRFRSLGRIIANLSLTLACAAPAAAAAQSVPNVEFGRYLSSECTACHQLSGRAAGIPPIVGLAPMDFIAAMNEFRARKRDNVIMQTIAGKFRDEEIAALAAYFGALTPAK